MTWPRQGPKEARSAAFIEAGEWRQRCEWNMSQPTSGDGLFWQTILRGPRVGLGWVAE